MNMHTLIPLLIAAGTVLGVATGRRFFVVIRVVGSSMLPSFHPHDRVLVRRIAGRKIAVGAVAVLAEPLDVRSWRLSPVATPRLAGTTWVIKRC
jgi:signal peptidase I